MSTARKPNPATRKPSGRTTQSPTAAGGTASVDAQVEQNTVTATDDATEVAQLRRQLAELQAGRDADLRDAEPSSTELGAYDERPSAAATNVAPAERTAAEPELDTGSTSASPGHVVKLPKADRDNDDEPERLGFVVATADSDGGQVAYVLPVDRSQLVPVFTADLGD